ncbi:MAG: pantoate--beta-alanine ligase [Bdellovibrionota bacterium]
MKILKSISSLKAWRKKQSSLKKSVGLVPTMGALHAGHIELVKKAQKNCATVVVSIFVNPTQFNKVEDLKNYPKTLKEDLALLKAANVDAVFLPTEKMLYPDDFNYKVSEENLSQFLCGEHRPGHFTGVLTVVLKLLNLTQSTQAFFGEKDFQQLKLIQGMAKALFLESKIVPVATVREKNGLALSSRNKRLSAEALEKAQIIPELLRNKKNSPAAIQKILLEAGFKVDYVEDHWKRRFVAAHVEGVRLIDNMRI